MHQPSSSLAPDSPEAKLAQVYSCTRCGACTAVCPTFAATGEEAISARGRMALIEMSLDGRLEMTAGPAGCLSKCLECGACTEVCPSGIDVNGAILAARTAAAAGSAGHALTRLLAGKLATGEHARPLLRLLAACEKVYRGLPEIPAVPWFSNGRKRTLPRMVPRPLESMIPEVTPARRAALRVALFPGCAASLAYQQTALAAVRVLSHSGAEVLLPRGLGCCGLPFRSLGEAEKAAAMRDETLRRLASHDADAIVTICSSCALSLKKAADETPGLPPVKDIHELLHKIGPFSRPAKPVFGRVTWHDPCHLGRGLGITSEPREIIAALPGVEYVESGELACCGGAGIFSLLHYGLSLKMGLARAEEIAATGASAVVTGCPGCRMQLEDMLARIGSRMRVVHTVELLDPNT